MQKERPKIQRQDKIMFGEGLEVYVPKGMMMNQEAQERILTACRNMQEYIQQPIRKVFINSDWHRKDKINNVKLVCEVEHD